MARDDLRTFQLESTIEQVRYWVPQIADVARVVESAGPDFWKISIAPHMPGTCAIEMTVRADDQFDAVIAGETYQARTLTSHGLVISLLESVADGRVLQRHWKSSATGALKAIETVIMLPDGTVWTGSHGLDAKAATWEHHDHHFLPYRRRR